MRYQGHKSINGVLIAEPGEYWAVATNVNPNVAFIEIHNYDAVRERDKTTYSDAAGNISYEVSAWRVHISKSGRVRRA